MGEFDCLVDSVIESTHFIHDTYLFTLEAQPYTSFADGLDIILADMTAFGTTGSEEVITALYHRLHHRALFGVHALEDEIILERRVLVGRDAIQIQTHFVTQFGYIRNGTENTDRTGDSGRLGIDIIRSAGDIITARSRVVTHRNNNRNAVCFDFLYGMPDLFAGVRRTTRAVDAQYKSLDIVVFLDFLERLHNLFADNTFSILVGYLTFEIEHSHFVFGFGFRTLYSCQLGSREHVVILRAGIDAKQRIHILRIDKRIYQTGFDLLLSALDTHIAVSECIELHRSYMTGCTHRIFVLRPDAVEVLLYLQTVCIGHRGTEERLNGGLECTYLEYLHLHAYLIQQSLVVQPLCRKSVPVDSACRVQTDEVRYGSHIVIGSAVRLRRSDNPFAALLEVEQCVTDSFRVRRAHSHRGIIEPNTENTVIGLRQTDVTQDIVQTDIVLLGVRAVRQRAHDRSKGVFRLSLLYERTFEFKAVNGLVFEFHFGGRGEHISHQPTQDSAAQEIDSEENEAASQATYSAARTLLSVSRHGVSVEKSHSDLQFYYLQFTIYVSFKLNVIRW